MPTIIQTKQKCLVIIVTNNRIQTHYFNKMDFKIMHFLIIKVKINPYNKIFNRLHQTNKVTFLEILHSKLNKMSKIIKYHNLIKIKYLIK